MRILHVTDTYLPRLGGIELHVADLAARQQASGHDVLVLTAERLRAEAETEAATAQVSVEHVRSGITGAGIGVSLGPVIASFAPDLVHAHLSVGSPFTWAVLRNTAGIPALVSLHSLLPDAPRLVRTAIRVTGIPTSRITFTAVSEAAAARLRPALDVAQPVHVLHNGIDSQEWKIDHLAGGPFNIVCVGRLASRKRPLVLVAALARLAASAPALDWEATIIGDGPQRAKVARAVRAHGLEGRINLTGTLTRKTIRQHLARADVLVAPATLESFGIAALEARSAGVPIIGMAASGMTEFVTDGIDGLLARTDADISACLQRLATDPGLTAAIRRHNTTVPVAMEWSTVLARHQVLYATAMDRAGVPVNRFAQPVRIRSSARREVLGSLS